MYYVYIIKSVGSNWFYVGMAEDVQNRLEMHNCGIVRSTKARKPYILVFKLECDSRIEARDKEKYYKIRSHKENLLHKLGYLT